jgi:hypothetical protein
MAEACPFETPDCKYFNLSSGCFSDIHHLYFPRREYRSPTEKRFRELSENKVQLCRQDHDDLHAVTDIPEKPDLEIMRQAIQEEKDRRLAA